MAVQYIGNAYTLSNQYTGSTSIINTIVASNLIPTSVGRLHTDVGGEIGLSGGFTLSTRRGFNNGTMARLWRRR